MRTKELEGTQLRLVFLPNANPFMNEQKEKAPAMIPKICDST